MSKIARTPDDADIKNWIASLELKAEDVRASMSYDMATTFCADCPHRRDADVLDFVAPDCCKDTDTFYTDAEQESQERFFANIKAAKAALKALLSED